MKQQYAIVVSRFNQTVTDKLLEGALLQFIKRGIHRDHITVIQVPGAVEIPLATKLLAETNVYAAIVALGAVIRGETSHYDYVCEQVSQGCQRVMLDYNVPVIFGVLTTEDEDQALARAGGIHGHKGADAADCALEMAALVKNIQGSYTSAKLAS